MSNLEATRRRRFTFTETERLTSCCKALVVQSRRICCWRLTVIQSYCSANGESGGRLRPPTGSIGLNAAEHAPHAFRAKGLLPRKSAPLEGLWNN
jgi:hypothetical protein